MPSGGTMKDSTPGTSMEGFLQTFARPVGVNDQGADIPIWDQNLLQYFYYWEDFLYDAYDPDETGLAVYDISAAGSPTAGLVADAAGGVFNIQLATTDELELVGLSQGGNLYIQGNKPFLFAARVQVRHTMAANQKVLIGLASELDFNDPDSVLRNLWFMYAADFVLKIETDDNTTDDDDNSTGLTLVEDTWYWYVIERTPSGQHWFRVLDGDGTTVREWNMARNFSGAEPAMGANNLQPVIAAYKTSGTTQPQVYIDAWGYLGYRAM